MNVIVKLKSLYEAITRREKLLLVLFVWVIVLIWASLLERRVSASVGEIKTVNASLVHQQIWLDSEASIEERLIDSRKILDPAKTYAKNQFIAKVDGIARGSGAVYDITNPTTTLGDVFNEHTLTIQFRDAPMKALLAFEAAIEKEGSYIAITEVKISPNRRDPALLNAQFDIIALELKKVENVAAIKQKNS